MHDHQDALGLRLSTLEKDRKEEKRMGWRGEEREGGEEQIKKRKAMNTSWWQWEMGRNLNPFKKYLR